VAAAEATVGHERAASLQTRLSNEDILAEKALQKPLFGWGRWGRNRVYDENGNDISITDGLWVLALGQAGLVGLASLTAVFLVPALNVRRVVGKRGWREPMFAAPIVLALLLVLYMMDNLLNAMVNPIFTLIAGGLTGLRRPRLTRVQARKPDVEDGAREPVHVEQIDEERAEQAA
jgi:O-antigen ligase